VGRVAAQLAADFLNDKLRDKLARHKGTDVDGGSHLDADGDGGPLRQRQILQRGSHRSRIGSHRRILWQRDVSMGPRFVHRGIAFLTYSLAIRAVDLLFAVPLGVSEVFESRRLVRVVLPERQVAGGRLRLFFCNDDDPNPPLRQSRRRFREVDFAGPVKSFDDRSHGMDLLKGMKMAAFRTIMGPRLDSRGLAFFLNTEYVS